MNRTFALIVVEGALEVPVSLRLLRACGLDIDSLSPINKGGRNAFWKHARRYNNAANKLGLVLGLADLESDPCPSGLIQEHLPSARHPNFVLRIAERMLESWLLADVALATFLNISPNVLPRDPDSEANPKQTLVNLARRSRQRDVRNDLVPESGSRGIVGKGYTPRMTEFIEEHWSPTKAATRSDSLRRAIAAILKATSV